MKNERKLLFENKDFEKLCYQNFKRNYKIFTTIGVYQNWDNSFRDEENCIHKWVEWLNQSLKSLKGVSRLEWLFSILPDEEDCGGVVASG